MNIVDQVIEERNALASWTESGHLCIFCDHIFDSGWVNSTQDENGCKNAYLECVTKQDNGMGYWIISCPNYTPIDTKKLYGSWINSKEWKEIAREAIKRADYKCERCGNAINLNVHHVTYKHLCMEDKFPEDLAVLCNECHKQIHGIEE